jgi:hypothetical protein
MNAPVLRNRLDVLVERRAKIDAEIEELRGLLGDRAIITPTGRRSRLDVPECGTETAYQRHMYRRRKFGEPVPEDCGCRAAHAAHNRLGVDA